MICAHNSGAEVGTLPLPAPSGWAVNRPRLAISACFKNGPLCHSRPRQQSGEPGALRCRQRMMFVHDVPPSVKFAQTHRQSKFEGLTFAVHINVDAPPYCGSEANILAGSHLHIVKGKGNGLLSRREKRLPSRQ